MSQKQLISYFCLIVVLPLSVLGVVAYVYRGGGQQGPDQTAMNQKNPADQVEDRDSQQTMKGTPATPEVKKMETMDSMEQMKPMEKMKTMEPMKTMDQAEPIEQAPVMEKMKEPKSMEPMKQMDQMKSAEPETKSDASSDSDELAINPLQFEKSVRKVIKSQYVKVIFPDTIEIEEDGKKVQVRLESVYCPRRGKPFHDEARQFVEESIAASAVEIHKTGDSRGRYFGYVIVDGKNLNYEMVRNGLAWHYTPASSSKELAALQENAKLAKRGIWKEGDAPEPWKK